MLHTKRLNCSSSTYIVRIREFAVWVCLMVFANAALIGVRSDTLTKRSIDVYENQSIDFLYGASIDVFD